MYIVVAMSNETLEISVGVDERFDMSFNISEGVLGFILDLFRS